MKNQKFRKLKVWEKAIAFVEVIYRLTQNFPKIEQYGLTSQIRRASLSISLNIAEGSGVESQIEFNRFIAIALRSTYEVNCAIEIAERLNYIESKLAEELFSKCDEISTMLSGLSKKIKKDLNAES